MPDSSRAVSRRVGAAAVLLILPPITPTAHGLPHPWQARCAPHGDMKMKMMKNTVFAAIAAAAIAAAYAYGANNSGKATEPKHDEITTMRLEAAKKQAELEELNALISLEERQRIAEEEADYRWVHGDAEVPEGKE